MLTLRARPHSVSQQSKLFRSVLSKRAQLRRFQYSARTLAYQQQKTSSPTRSAKTMRREFNLALASGLLLATSYMAFTRNGLLSDSFSSSDTNGNFIDKKPGSADSKSFFSTATTNSLQNSGLSEQQHKQGIYLLSPEQVSARLREFEESYNVNRELMPIGISGLCLMAMPVGTHLPN
ncbi:unnamed protein product [Ambrosiozyma monospora]|uniref:Unnamed protein product n=1 Tax=Ambrosiozyma monospora TaxID=43982 RepID=A0ACB5T8U5_AMBMO|nr:unnamed protein product [Ambrosiozyma monospora]